jgi:hypothetical protein
LALASRQPTGRLTLGQPLRRIHEIACPSENVLYVAELLNWRVQKLVLNPKK